MIEPVLFIGRGGGEPALLRYGVGYLDDGESYEMLALSRPVAIAGPGGECMYTLLYLTTKHYDDDVSIWITPVIDGVAQPTQRIDLTGVPGTQGEQKTHEVSLAISYMVGGTERLRYAPRGTWFSVQVETKYALGEAGAAANPAKQIVESVEVEYEVLRETLQPAGVTP